MKIYQILLFILLSIVVSSYTPKAVISHNDLDTIEKGQNIDVFNKEKNCEPEYSFCFESNSNNFCCDIYCLVYSTTTSSSDKRSITTFLTKDFCILYLNNKLHYCFVVSDINKEEDSLTRSIAPFFINKYLEFCEE